MLFVGPCIFVLSLVCAVARTARWLLRGARGGACVVAEPRCVVITGASSGIGAALACAYARRGITLGLVGRNAQQLQEVKERCTASSPKTVVHVGVLDVTDAVATSAFLRKLDDSTPVDVVIANAGISAGTFPQSATVSEAQQWERIVQVNLQGAINTVLPLKERMMQRRRGQIVVVSSLAGYTFGSSPYDMTKAALITMGRTLRMKLAPHNVGVTVLLPAFVKSPMTDSNTMSMPFMISTGAAVEYMVHGIEAGEAVYSFPSFPSLVWLASVFPADDVDVLLSLAAPLRRMIRKAPCSKKE
eukprot:TRINITY_DN227_c0_g3_i1.p1 TRINITY_DN227_c0_g3~~TRINITY_DN227_c0_g3_i1.p1  ORF type:complete len:334 (-),score=81.92 TRINITY_DN227_c0_g3_i1:141-1046(-)